MGPTPSEPGARPLGALRALRDAALAEPGLAGPALRAALSEIYDRWLARLPVTGPGVGLVAVGGLGRREPAPYSDLDLLLLHDVRGGAAAELADRVWYPIWDSGVRLDHAARSLDDALAVARADLPALLGMLWARPVAGDVDAAGRLRERVRALWRAEAPKRLGELRELSRQRWDLAGHAAFLLEPDLKLSRGGLRDGQALQALALTQLVDVPPAATRGYGFLLDVRGELHRHAGRASDVLHLQDREAVAAALEIGGDGGPPADVLLRRVNLAARAIDHALTGALRRIAASAGPETTRGGRSGAPAPRLPLARDLVSQDGEVVLARDARVRDDPGLVLRAARVAAEHELPLSSFLLRRLREQAPPSPDPWPEAAREELVRLLGAGSGAIAVLESLDLAGLLAPLIPGWESVRGRAQHNPVHRHTVDRHLLETAAEAAAHTRDVTRPDLLLIAALLHDIGKGSGPDHSVAGAEVAATAARRMGLPAGDVDTVATLVRHHLLLVETATGRDLDDPRTVEAVARTLGGDEELLDLLYALTVADARATGPLAWNAWRAGLVADLVNRVRGRVHGSATPAPPELDPELRELAEAGEPAVRYRADGAGGVAGVAGVAVVAPDAIGVLYRGVGVLALHGLDVRAAAIHTHAGMAVNVFDVEARFGQLPDVSVLRADLTRTLRAAGDLAERLRAKERAYGDSLAQRSAPTVRWLDGAATDATLLEIRAENRIGLLCRVTAALERCRLDVRAARIRSIGNSVIDSFYVTARDGGPVPAGVRSDVEVELRGV